MAKKSILYPKAITGQSLSASFQGTAYPTETLDNLCYQIVVTTSDSQGTFSILASNDGVNFDAVTLGGSNSGIPTVAAANTTISININQWPYAYVALNYTSTTAGTGTCSIAFGAKQIGG
jgi:hypothetical protein